MQKPYLIIIRDFIIIQKDFWALYRSAEFL